MTPTISPEQIVPLITALLAAGLSLALELVPGLKEKWADFKYKSQVWVGGAVALAVLLLGADALGAVNLVLPEPFWWDGFWAWVTPVLTWITSGQIFYAGMRMFGVIQRKDEADGNVK